VNTLINAIVPAAYTIADARRGDRATRRRRATSRRIVIDIERIRTAAIFETIAGANHAIATG
jgi:hypothetical protein